MLKPTSRQSAAWSAALLCVTLLSGIPALAGLSTVAQESTSAGVAAQVTPVTLDPASGRPIAVWSQFDGVSNKIAYARLENGVWTDYHYLTFGRGHHTSPRIGVTRDGAFLFWIADGKRYEYAPIDLATGRLHASPKRVPLETGGIHLLADNSRRGTGTEGGSDVPIVTEGGSDVPVITECPLGDENCIIVSTIDTRRTQILAEGGSDVPVITECPAGDDDCNVVGAPDTRRQPIQTEGGSDVPVIVETEALWSVTSRPSCNLMILSIPSAEAGAYHLLKLESGRINKAGRIRLLPGSDKGLPSVTAGPMLDSACF